MSAPALIGGVALMAESAFDYWSHNRLQATADAAAYAAAVEKRSGSGYSAISAAARSSAVSNGWTQTAGGIEVHTPPVTGAQLTEEAVEVVLRQPVPRFFTALFTAEPLVARARAVAAYETVSNACVLALNPRAHHAVRIQGAAKVDLKGCDVVANSVADDALSVWGASRLTADCAAAAGGIQNKGGITVKACAAPIPQAPRVRDPFADLPAPAGGQVRSVPNNPKGIETLWPGSYPSGMQLNGDFTLMPGVYRVSGGDFRINGSSSVSGSGVTIYLERGSNVTMNGGATIKMSAPTSGPYAGMLFFGARDGDGDNSFNGNATSSLTGHIYFPSQAVEFAGNFSGAGGCTHVVADTVSWTGSVELEVDCEAKGMKRIPARQAVRIVE